MKCSICGEKITFFEALIYDGICGYCQAQEEEIESSLAQREEDRRIRLSSKKLRGK